MAEETPVVGIIMGSESDMPAMEPCMAQLDAMGVPYEVKVESAHRKPAVVHEWAETAHDRGIKLIITAALVGSLPPEAQNSKVPITPRTSWPGTPWPSIMPAPR